MPRIAEFVQLTIAPVFLLSAVASILVVLTTRLGRIVDRARVLEERWPGLHAAAREPLLAELRALEHRSRLVQLALTLSTACAPVVCVLITCGFLGLVLHARFAWAVALLFMAAMAMFTSALLVLLREVFVATATLRVGLPASARTGCGPAVVEGTTRSRGTTTCRGSGDEDTRKS
jgi:hypothetical protein